MFSIHCTKQLENCHFSSNAFAISNHFPPYWSIRNSVIVWHTPENNLEIVTSLIKYWYMEFFYSVSVHIQFECRKIRTRKTSNTDIFRAVRLLYVSPVATNRSVMLRFSSGLIGFWNLVVNFSNLFRVFDSKS